MSDFADSDLEGGEALPEAFAMDELYECYFSSGGAPTTPEKPDRGELVASRRVSSRLCALREPFASQIVATNQEPSDARASITKAIWNMFGS